MDFDLRRAMETGSSGRVAIAPFLLESPFVATLGVRAAMGEYSRHERDLLLRAERIFFPTPRFSPVFKALGKTAFPAATTYGYQRFRNFQQLLIQYLDLPHPFTRIYHGDKQKSAIRAEFEFPMVAMGPRAVPGSRHLVEDPGMLAWCAARYNPVIVQAASDWSELIRLLCVNFEVVGAIRRVSPSRGPHACLDSQSFEPVPLDHELVGLPVGETRKVLRAANLDDVVFEWGYDRGCWRALGMSRPPVRWPTPSGGLNRLRLICGLIESGML